jgi:hypothetical protein
VGAPPANRWVLNKTWAVVDKLAMMRRQGHLTTMIAQQMGHKIKSLLAADCKQRAANAASTVKSHLSTDAVKEAWRTLKGWYRLAEDQPPLACPETMIKQTDKHMGLYVRALPMGAALPHNLPHFKISNNMPTDLEMHPVVRGLQNRQAAGATRMRAEHLKGWLDNIQHNEKAARENPGMEGADPGASYKWWIFVELIQTIWERGGNSGADKSDGYHPATKGWQQFPVDRPT